jgi:hypothetical protein
MMTPDRLMPRRSRSGHPLDGGQPDDHPNITSFEPQVAWRLTATGHVPAIAAMRPVDVVDDPDGDRVYVAVEPVAADGRTVTNTDCLWALVRVALPDEYGPAHRAALVRAAGLAMAGTRWACPPLDEWRDDPESSRQGEIAGIIAFIR